MLISPSRLSFCLVFVLSLTAGLAGAQTALRWSSEEDQTWALYLVQTTKTRIGDGERAQSLSTAAAMDLEWKVGGIRADEGIPLDCRFTRFRFKVLDGSPAKRSYDSAKPDAVTDEFQELDRSIRPLLKAPFQMALAPNGKIQDVRLPSSTQSRIASSPVADKLSGILSEAGLIAILQQSLGRLPDEPVETGDSWTAKRSVDSPLGKLSIESRYTYEGSRKVDGRSLERIRIGGVVTRTTDSGEDGTGTFEGQELTGELLFSASENRLVQSRVTLRLKTTVTVDQREVPVHSESDIRLTLEPGG